MLFTIRPWRVLVLVAITAILVSLWSLSGHQADISPADTGPKEVYKVKKPESQSEGSDVQGDSKPVNEGQDDNVQPKPGPPEPIQKSRMCEKYPDPGNVAFVVKTGATALHRLPPLLNTTLSCIDDVILLSDLDQEIQGIKVHDVLSLFDESYKETNPDFEIYWKQKKFKMNGEEDKIPQLASMPAPVRDDWGRGKKAGWALDKYKFVPEVEMAYQLKPGKDWYVFLEGDTYLSWPSMLRWLKTLDSKERRYIGYAIRKSDDKEPMFFAHGGGGFVISGPAAKEAAVDHRGMTSRLAPHMRDWWAGDFMIADALYDEMGLKVSDVQPMINMFDPEANPFGINGMWCQPTITLHHMDEAKVLKMFKKEEDLNYEQLLLRDIYDVAYSDGIPSKRDNWDNSAQDKKLLLANPKASSSLDPNKDFDSCKAACEKNNFCFSFIYLNTTTAAIDPNVASVVNDYKEQNMCYLSSAFRLGKAKEDQPFDNQMEPGTFRSWTSGWRTEKIDEWVKSRPECPAGDHWVPLDHGKAQGGSGSQV